MPVNAELLEILVCPETKQPVSPAGDDILSKLNRRYWNRPFRTVAR